MMCRPFRWYFLLLVTVGCSRSNEGTAAQDAGGGAGERSAQPGAAAACVFTRQSEPRENAFTILVPRGWTLEGGIFRVDPTAAGGPANAIEAKLDLAVKKDAAGTVMIRSLPDLLYFDARRSPAGQMGLFPPGSTYQGMTVWPVLTADEFLLQVVLPKAHPGAAGLRVVERKKHPETAHGYGQRVQAMMGQTMTFTYDAATVTVT